MVRTQSFHCQVLGSSPGWGTKIPQALEHGQKINELKKQINKTINSKADDRTLSRKDQAVNI